jgi:hypothetical protein
MKVVKSGLAKQEILEKEFYCSNANCQAILRVHRDDCYWSKKNHISGGDHGSPNHVTYFLVFKCPECGSECGIGQHLESYSGPWNEPPAMPGLDKQKLEFQKAVSKHTNRLL